MARPDRRQAEIKGRRAETLCALVLRLKGYRILETRAKLRGGEIDLIAARGQLIAFIEVKARADEDAARHAISDTNRNRIIRASEEWMARHPQLSGFHWRFDAMLVAPNRWPKHVKDAWRA